MVIENDDGSLSVKQPFYIGFKIFNEYFYTTLLIMIIGYYGIVISKQNDNRNHTICVS
jgi:hypothetical protein